MEVVINGTVYTIGELTKAIEQKKALKESYHRKYVKYYAGHADEVREKSREARRAIAAAKWAESNPDTPYVPVRGRPKKAV